MGIVLEGAGTWLPPRRTWMVALGTHSYAHNDAGWVLAIDGLGKPMSRRIVIEEVEPCHHGKMESHRWAWSGWCPGGTTLARSVLSEPSEEMVERAARAMRDTEETGYRAQARAALTAALFSSDAGEREET
jgi:hypothetical protein